MIYSRWRPDTGGYDYFQAAERRGLGDDLPVPRLTGGTDIGVPSTEVGRPSPGGLRPLGSGPIARGSILPVSRQGLSAVDWMGSGGVVAGVLFVGALAAIVAVPGAAGGYLAAGALGKDKKKWALYGAVGTPVALLGWNLIEKRLLR